ncbi:choice-of-anchor G family protein [Promicromonospora sp. NPDC057488]|uniref:choice-of-anchor G family protein n=1 Tax=Promicromonospora sp. NPDC057488 TaxID=3346147 RepID=UPI00366B4E61
MDNYPDEPAEAAASVLAAELMQQALLGAATSDAGSVSNPGPNTENLDVEVLGSQVLALGDLQLPVDQFLDFGQIGALASTSEASGPADAHAVSGLLGADGGVTLDGAQDAFGTASLDVLSLARLAGVDGISDAVVDQLTIELGALAAEVTAEDGVILDPDGGVTGPGQYRLGDGTLLLHSPVIEDAAATIFDIGGAVDSQIETLVNDTFDVSELTALLSAVPGIPEPTVTVDSNMQETLFQSVVGEPITSANQLVTIDFSTGELQLHLEHLVEGNDPWGGGDDVGMNGLAPNYEVLDDQTYPQIAEGVHEIMQEATRIMIGAIEDSLNAVTINIAFFDESPFGTLDVSWSVPLADAVNGDFPQVVNNSTGTQAVTGTLLATTINGLGNAAAPIFGAVYDLVISDEGDQIFDLLINDLKSGITSTIGAALSPVFDVLVQFVSLQINYQETANCTTAGGDELLGQVEVSALSLGLVQSADAGRIGLGNAGVRVDACDLAAIAPTLTVDPAEVAPGGTTTVTGAGYTPDATATVQLTDADGNPVGDPVTVDTDADGGFTTPLVVPDDAEPGDYTVVGTDDTTGTPAEAPLTLTDAPAVTPELTVDPTEVAPGECTEVSGTGYTPSSTATVQLTDADGNPVGDPITVDTDENGAFTTELCVPEGAEPGDYTVVGTDDATDTPAEAPLTVTPAAAIDPTITVAPSEVAPGGTTTVTGEGFTPDSTATVQLTDADGNPVGDPITVDTDENGTFTTPLVVPEAAEPGDFTVIGTDDTTGTPAEAPLTVITAAEQCESAPAITVTPSSTPAGEDVTVVGTGFPAGVDVTVQLTDADDNPVGEPVVVTPDETCSFATPYAIPENAEPGDYEVVAEPEDGTEGATAPLTVEGAGDGPTITVEPAEAHASEDVTVTGTGYTPDSTVDLEIVSDLGVLYTAGAIPTDEEGGFEHVVTLPADSYPTDYIVTGTDAEDLTANTDLVVLPLEPTLTVEPSEAFPGDEVTVTGAGYTPDSTVNLEIARDLDFLYTADDIPTDAEGGFEYVVTLPEDSAPTGYVATGTDFSTDVFATDDLVVLDPAAEIDPTITVAPSEVAPGGTTTVTGEDFTPDSTATVQLADADGYPVGDPVTVDTDADGAFTTPLVVPEDAEPGDLTVVATDDTTGTPAEAPLTVITAAEQCESAPALTVTPSSAPAGTDVTVVGTGFPAGVDVTVQLTDADGNPVGDSVVVTPDDTCSFATPYPIPDGTEPGDYEVVAEPEDGSEGATAPLTVEGADIAPAVTVDPSEVAPGGTTTVTGEGFTPDATATVQLTDADDNPVGEPVTVDTDENGAFTTDLVVPEDAEPGDHTVVATDDTTGTPAEAALVVDSGAGPGEECTDPALVADPTTVEPGGEVTVTGTGFPAGVEVTVTLTDASGEPVGEPVTVVPDESCGFTVTITVPEDAEPGVHVIVGEPEDGSDGAEVPITVAGPGARVLSAWFEEETVAPGASQTFYASGFEPGEMVVGTVRSTSLRLPAVAADESGEVQWTFTVPSDLATGTHIGIAASTTIGDSAAAQFQVVATSAGGGDGDGAGTGSTGGSTSGSGNDSGLLASTGADVATLVTATVLLLGIGALLIRRRRELGMAIATAAGRVPDEE